MAEKEVDLGELKWSRFDAREELTLRGYSVVEVAVYVCVRSLKYHTGAVRCLWPMAAAAVDSDEVAKRVLELELLSELRNRCRSITWR